MIEALTGAISAITSLLWLGVAVCVVIYFRRPIREVVENVARSPSGIIEISTRHIRVEWRSIATAAANLTWAAFEKGQGEQELPRIVNSLATSVEVAASGAAEGKNILWVDDQPENNIYGTRALESQGISVLTSRSTSEALEQIKRHDFVVIVTDQLRVENGAEDHEAGTHLLEAVRKEGVQTPVILSTAFPDKLKAQNRGFFDATNTQHGVYELVMRAITQRARVKQT
jgi:CheY-like chemotaxis protein